MSQQLINHSPDLKSLQKEGFELEVKGGYLLIHQIPYIDSTKEIKRGTLVTELSQNGGKTITPNTHVIFFIGEQPCDKEGNKILAIEHSSSIQNLGNNIIVNRSFSNKPSNGYPNYYEKVKTYVSIISSPAISKNPKVTPLTYRERNFDNIKSVFNYTDTNSSRANIDGVNEKIKGQKIAIIGLGGTGSYILDLISKSPVDEIHLYDGDILCQHNIFRSPGACPSEELDSLPFKVDYYSKIYSNLHKHIFPHSVKINEANIDELKKMNYVFICIDDDKARKKIIQFLVKLKITFIDVGLGVNIVDDMLIGTLRVTTATENKNDHLESKVSFVEEDNNDYAANIQIAELNCLNAVLAVIKWKKLSGFYQDLQEEHQTTYSINMSQLLNEDTTA